MKRGLLICATAAVLAGCGVHVKYDKPNNDEDGLVKFRLTGSLVTLAAKQEAKPTGQGGQQTRDSPDGPKDAEPPMDVQHAETFPCSSTPITKCFEKVSPVVTPTYGSELLAVRVHDWPWRKTILSATYLDRQPQLLKELGVDVTDYSVEAIGAVASIAKAAMGLGLMNVTPGKEREVAAPTPTPRQLVVPSVIDVSAALPDGEAGDWNILPNNHGWWYKLEKTEPMKGIPVFKDDNRPSGSSVSASKYFADFREGGSSTVTSFPVAACSGAKLTLMFAPGISPEEAKGVAENPPPDSTIVISNLLIADPRFVETYPIPEKGSIKFKAICGADVDSKPSGVASGWKVLQTIAEQAKAVFDAQNQDPKKQGTAGQK